MTNEKDRFQEFLDTPSPYDLSSPDPKVRERAAAIDWAEEGKKRDSVAREIEEDGKRSPGKVAPSYGVIVDVRVGPRDREPQFRVALTRQTQDTWELAEMERGSPVWHEYALRARRDYKKDVLYFPRSRKESDHLHLCWMTRESGVIV